ncbi:MAG: Coq4 family protein [Parasphingorhabdus sp.]|uniref:Coq4 family protein n=1 Tax=Parasphingorhabdus sp. TaxID=2709688 RepID=UPI00326382EC
MDDIPYLARGVELLGTDSSILVSSSKYLNDPRLREWVAKIALKKNGADYPPAAEMYELINILDDLRDYERLEALIADERKNNAQFDRWFEEWHCSEYVIEDLKDCASGTVGGIYYQAATQGSYEVQIVPNFKPQNQWQYYSLRAGQTHDYEHILTGAGFNYIGELLPYWFRLATIDTHIQNKELAGEMNVMGILGTTRYLIRTVLHYPETWGAALKCIEQGISIGRHSDPFWMAKIEDVWNMPLEEAREHLGVRGAVDLDTAAEGDIWSGLKSG